MEIQFSPHGHIEGAKINHCNFFKKQKTHSFISFSKSQKKKNQNK